MPEVDDISTLYAESRRVARADDAINWFSRLPRPQAETATKEADRSKAIPKVVPLDAKTGSVAATAVSETVGFLRDVPLQTIGAFRDVVQEVADITQPVASFLDKHASLGAIRVGDSGVEYVAPSEWSAKVSEGEKGSPLPEIPEGHSALAPLYRGIARFAIGFKGVGTAMKAAGVGARATAAGRFGQDTLQAAAADMVVWDEHEARLSDLIESYPALNNPVTEYLKTDMEDGMFEGKLKQALEGAVAGTGAKLTGEAVKLLARGVKAIKAGRAAKEKIKPPSEDDILAAERDDAARDILILGDPNEPLVRTIKTPNPQAAVRSQLDEGTAGAGVDPAHTAGSVIEAGKRGPDVPAEVEKLMPNFARINGEADIDAAIKEMAAANSDLIARGKGGVISQAETAALAREIGIQDVMTMDAGRFNRAEILALKDFYAASANMLMETAKAAVAAPTEGKLFAFRKAMAVHQTLLEKFSAAKAEAGRTLNILGRMSDTGNAERLSGIKDFLSEMGGPDVALEMAKKVRMLETASAEALNGVVSRGAAARTIDAVREAWTLGLVSGVRTQGRNIFSNAAYAFQRTAERAVAARLPGAEVEKGEALAMLHGMFFSLNQAFVNSGKAFWNGTSGYGVGKVDLPHRRAISGENFGLHGAPARVADAFGELWRVWGRALNAGDEFFKTINYNGEIAALSLRAARKGGKAGDDYAAEVARLTENPTEEMRIAARASAQEGTFTKRVGVLGEQVLKLKASENPAVSIPATFLMPFVTTVANISKTGIAHTPFAVAMPKSFWAEVKKGGAARDTALAKVAMGSSVMALWSDLTTRGSITGSGPSDPAERALWREAGFEPYSVKIADKWYNYRAIEPIGMVMGIAADVTERLAEYRALSDADDPDAEAKMNNLVAASIGAIGNSILSQTFSRSLSEFFAVMQNPDMYAERWIQNWARSAVPRIVPSIHEMAGATGADEWKDVNSAYEAIKAQVAPWSVKPARDFFGHEIKREGAWPGFLSAVSPIYVGDANGPPAARALYEQGIGVRRPTAVQTFVDPESGLGVRMDLREYPAVKDAFERYAGHQVQHPMWGVGMEQLLNEIVEGKHPLAEIWNALPNGDEDGIEDKGKFVRGLVNEYRQFARETIMQHTAFGGFQSEVKRRAGRRRDMQMEGLLR